MAAPSSPIAAATTLPANLVRGSAVTLLCRAVSGHKQQLGRRTPVDLIPATACCVATPNQIFRQLFEKESSTYTYLLGCAKTGEAVLIDTVDLTAERDAGQAGIHAETRWWWCERNATS